MTRPILMALAALALAACNSTHTAGSIQVQRTNGQVTNVTCDATPELLAQLRAKNICP